MKKKNIYIFKQHFATTFRCLTKKFLALMYRSIFPVYLTVLAPIKNVIFYQAKSFMFDNAQTTYETFITKN